jgi:hypothetical protein
MTDEFLNIPSDKRFHFLLVEVGDQDRYDGQPLLFSPLTWTGLTWEIQNIEVCETRSATYLV